MAFLGVSDRERERLSSIEQAFARRGAQAPARPRDLRRRQHSAGRPQRLSRGEDPFSGRDRGRLSFVPTISSRPA